MLTERTLGLLKNAEAELHSGNRDQCERFLFEALAIDPNHANGLHFAARIMLDKGDLDLAQGFAERAIGLKSVAAYVLTYAEILKAKGDFQKAASLFQKVLEKAPNEARALLGMGEIYENANYRDLALQHYRRALDIEPKNAGLALRYFGLLPPAKYVENFAVIEGARPNAQASVKARLGYLNQYIVYKEWAERVRHGQMPFHSVRLDESFFHYAAADRDAYEKLADEILRQDPSSRAGNSAKALCLLSRDQRSAAEDYYAKQPHEEEVTVNRNIAFKPSFYKQIEALSDTELVAGLPPLITLAAPAFEKPDIIYLSCNYDYYDKFARTMLLSIAAVGRNPQVHLHIMDGSDEDWGKVKTFCASLNATIAISAERPNADAQGGAYGRSYYHAIRFIRLLHHLEAHNKTLWMMDVDALLNRDPQPMFDGMADADVAFRARPGRWEPWNQYNASVVAFRPTDYSRVYLRLIAAYIAHFFKGIGLGWGIDQLAMYGAFKYLQDENRAPKAHLLDDRAVDYDYFNDGFVWCNSGRGKFMMLHQMSKGVETSSDPLRAKYYTLLKTYLDQVT